MSNADGGVKYPLRGRASRLKIKRKQVAKQKFIKALKTIAPEMVKIRRFICKANIPNIFKISFS